MDRRMLEEMVKLLNERSERISCAESCTGGRIAAAITAIPGSSSVFPGSVVSYSNEVKQSLLSVPLGILNGPGAVSEECALAMALGVRELLHVDYAVSATGIAGPDGGTDTNPVGTVWIGWAGRDGQARAQRFVFTGSRVEIQQQAADKALEGLANMLGLQN